MAREEFWPSCHWLGSKGILPDRGHRPVRRRAHLRRRAVTPAISVLSALEGLNMVTPAVQPYVLPAAVVILIGLFVAQPLGTERIGKAFGPIMGLWFLTMAVLGLAAIWHQPVCSRP